jgi:uncharacterized metal-binding protein YceD (DUF177 family)
MQQKQAPTSPIIRFCDLSDLTEAGSTIDIAADGEELIRLADWADVSTVSNLHAKVLLRRHSFERFTLSADFSADIEQKCVVTLEPVFSHIEKTVKRELHYSKPQRTRRHTEDEGELTLAAGSDEAPETIDTLHFDICASILEELSLSIDPYPRKAGATFAGEEAPEEKPENPFAVLKTLKTANEP